MPEKTKEKVKEKLEEVFSFKVTTGMKEKMKGFDNFNWSGWLRSLIQRKVEELEKIEEESSINFCGQCGKRLLTANDKFCRNCGMTI